MTLLSVALPAAGLALILRKLLNGRRWLPQIVAEAAICDVCSGFWSSVIMVAVLDRTPLFPLDIRSMLPVWALILSSTAIVALWLRAYNRIDPGPTMWIEEQNGADHTEHTH